jgi:hypothetical protein
MPNIEHLATLLCRNVRQGSDGLVSLDGLIDMVAVSALPPERVAVGFECCIVSSWRRNDDPGAELRQRVSLQFGRTVGERIPVAGPDHIQLLDRHLFTVVNRISELPLRGHGQYWFVVEQQDREGEEWRDAPPTAGLWVPSPEELKRTTMPRDPSPGLLRKFVSSTDPAGRPGILAEPLANIASTGQSGGYVVPAPAPPPKKSG